ncbi:hypothetical protein LCGC14_0470620 [marine sediment metagenome]|uniref:Uncharacterized protein n=1 Tax=marine sediment metagenome TaxID=412755 RepID=A0A0F9VL48_9ZZZZ
MIDSIATQAALGTTVIAVAQAPPKSLLQYLIFDYPASDYIVIITFVVFLASAGISIWRKIKK